jgi:cytoskeletal protein CcmA (bactofilin family)
MSGDTSTIGAGARVHGRVTGDGDLVVAGRVEGDISVRGDLAILDGGHCASNVEAQSVTVSGSLAGDVAASGTVTIGAGASMRGNVRGGALALEDGASFAGRIELDFELPEGLEDDRAGHAGSAGGARRR